MVKKYEVLKIYIDRSTDGAEALYKSEAQRDAIIQQCARRWAEFVTNAHIGHKVTEKDFWTISLPTALYDLLNSFDRRASYTAAKLMVQEYEAQEEAIKRFQSP